MNLQWVYMSEGTFSGVLYHILLSKLIYDVQGKKRAFILFNIIFSYFAKNIDCGYSLEPPRQGGSNEYPQPMFRAEI